MKVGTITDNHFSGHGNMTKGSKKKFDDLHLAELLDLMQEHRVPSNIETAAFTPAVNDTWEDFDLIAALNLVLTTQIRTSEAVKLRGTLEFVNGEAAVNNAKYGHGDMPDDDDTVRTFATAAASASEFVRDVELITDSVGQIKIEVDDRTNLTLVFHLESYQYVKTTAQV